MKKYNLYSRHKEGYSAPPLTVFASSVDDAKKSTRLNDFDSWSVIAQEIPLSKVEFQAK